MVASVTLCGRQEAVVVSEDDAGKIIKRIIGIIAQADIATRVKEPETTGKVV
jgi:hypothetical protein